MAFGHGQGQGKLKAEINVTPLVDVVLVLLIIFMVVTPMLSRGRDVDLPDEGVGVGKRSQRPEGFARASARG